MVIRSSIVRADNFLDLFLRYLLAVPTIILLPLTSIVYTRSGCVSEAMHLSRVRVSHKRTVLSQLPVTSRSCIEKSANILHDRSDLNLTKV